LKRYGLPEVGDVMKRVTRIHKVGLTTLVFICEEASLDNFHTRQVRRNNLGFEHTQHDGRHVYGDHTFTRRGHSESELPSAGANIYDGGLLVEAELLQKPHFFYRVRVFLDVVPGRMVDIEVFSTGACDLV